MSLDDKNMGDFFKHLSVFSKFSIMSMYYFSSRTNKQTKNHCYHITMKNSLL